MNDRTSENPDDVRTAFATSEWFDAWIDAFGDGTAGIWKSGDYERGGCAIPFWRERVSLGPRIGIEAAVSASNDHTPRYDVLGKIEKPVDVCQTMMSGLGVSLLRFDYLSEQSGLLQAFRATRSGLLYKVDFCEDSPFVNCDLDWEVYWNGLGSTRSLWGRRERKLMAEKKAEFRCLTDWRDVEPLLDEIYAVEASGWKGREGTAIKQSPATLSFYNRCVRDWARRGWLRLFILTLEGKIVAFQINVLFKGTLSQLKVGYDERHSKLSPGQVLQLQLLRWAFASPEVRIYDMLGGGGKAGETKRKWATDAEPLYSVFVFRRDLPGLLAWSRLVAAPRIKYLVTGNPGKVHQPIRPATGD